MMRLFILSTLLLWPTVQGAPSFTMQTEPFMAGLSDFNAVMVRAGKEEQAGNLEDAAELYIKALAILDRTRGPGGRSLQDLVTLFRLASVRDLQARWDEAWELYLQCREVQESLFQGSAHTIVGDLLNNMGLVQEHMGHQAEAQRYLAEALFHKDEALGLTDAATIISVRNLAGVMMRRSRYEETETLLVERLKVLEADWEEPPGHEMSVAAIKHLLAHTYYKLGRYKEALVLHLEALDTRQKMMGGDANNLELLISYNDLGCVYHDTGRLKMAAQLYQKVIEMAKKKKELASNAKGREVLANLAHLRRIEGNYDDSLDHLVRLTKFCREKYPPDTPYALFAQGVIYEDLKQLDEAAEMLLGALDLLATAGEPVVEGYLRQKVLRHLSVVRRHQRREQEADELMRQSHETVDQELRTSDLVGRVLAFDLPIGRDLVVLEEEVEEDDRQFMYDLL